jgi:membrane fusion protein (multidrug efflux system)
MKVLFHVPDVALAQLTPGQEVPVTVAPFPDKPFPGKILAIARSADPRSPSFEVQLILDNAEGKLRAGMIATVAIPEPNPAPLPAVPAAAITHDPVNGRYQLNVWKQVGGQLVVRRQYADTKPAGNGLVAITNGALQMGDRIVTRGGMLREDGDMVVEVKP